MPLNSNSALDQILRIKSNVEGNDMYDNNQFDSDESEDKAELKSTLE